MKSLCLELFKSPDSNRASWTRLFAGKFERHTTGAWRVSAERAIQAQLEYPLAKQILKGRFTAKDTITLDCTSGAMKFDKG
ncbi:MAG: hypothetical protein PHQ60_15935 [Sideroxydans sp.]|nr:hypothetical protein [Sideroxydans sp.]